MIEKIDIRNLLEAEKILELQKLSYVIEAEIIGCFELPPLRENIISLQNCDETFYGYYINDSIVGAISYKIDGQLLDIYRLMVNPNYFRRGIAKRLLAFIFNENKQIKEAVVSTGFNNYPAIILYKQFGFKEVEKIEIAKGIWITKLSKKIN